MIVQHFIYFLCFISLCVTQKPKLTFDEFFNYVSFENLKLSPDGSTLLVETKRPDWDHNRFRTDLSLYNSRKLYPRKQLTESGHDSSAQWSPNGLFIAFLSDNNSTTVEDTSSKIFIYSLATDNVSSVTTIGKEGIHAFTWGHDSNGLYYATSTPRTDEQQNAYKEEWKGVIQYRESERGDTVYYIDIVHKKNSSDIVTEIPYRVRELIATSNGHSLVFATESKSQRREKIDDFEIYLINIWSTNQSPIQLTYNEAIETNLKLSHDNKHVFFIVYGEGSVDGKYQEYQARLYSIDIQMSSIERMASDFTGHIMDYAVSNDSIGLVILGQLGTEVHIYSQRSSTQPMVERLSWNGTYENIATSPNLISSSIAFVYSALDKPQEVYFIENLDQIVNAERLTTENSLFLERDLPRGKPYRWNSDDNITVEGMLQYPLGKFEQKNLPLFVLIHGGPYSADGNQFEASWYMWATIAATEGWLVLMPNYRGSTGYGDQFLIQVIHEIVSRPGKDILAGVDSLVRDGIADPNHLTIGGYSYGGYLTNWLITQTTRFKAAVTGAGAVEHIANWGNDDVSLNDAYFLGGYPWEVPQQYHSEAAIYYVDKIETPTHMVAGDKDIRVAVLESFLFERALNTLNVPCKLLLFPREGHDLDKNPWHGKIKVREELRWLKMYGNRTV